VTSYLPAGCRHCRRRKGRKGHRGLCDRCHADRAVRELHPIPPRGAARVNPEGPRCLECDRRKGDPRSRGLCKTCHGDPSIRARYPMRRPDRPGLPCPHCTKRKGEPGRRGLCAKCYSDRTVREKYHNTPSVAPTYVGTCRHCKTAKVARPRGLCWRCYYDPEITKLYPSESPYANRGRPDTTGGFVLAADPTAHMPGTPGKVEVLESRAALGVALWHPDDARAASFVRTTGERILRDPSLCWNRNRYAPIDDGTPLQGVR
jgi:hypothetical protein